MNALLVFTTVLFAGACVADVSHILNQQPIATLRSEQDSSPDGAFRYGYETENGISVEAEGTATGEIKGSYRYTAPDGTPVQVNWTAGPDGYHAEGPSVPVVPESVIRTLQYNEAHPYKEPTQP
ncbi:larval cuticle protein LCP-17-like [Athalia rosae]|uniref:larval cuticle protein LCP-17-like n=1 Tax=Athalia rosae TaxID=37344 RepID=UPI000626AED7|nr:larval cuticle protein LCP-17-like [Athalia rosae]